MSRVVFYITVATIAFIVGVAANWSKNAFGVAVDKVYCEVAVDLKTFTISPDSYSGALPVHSCSLVVSVTADGALNLNNTAIGTLKDTSALTAMLRTLFEWREELHVYVPSPELSSRVPEYRQIEKTVYIKAPRSISYGEVADLVAAVKESGAHPVGLIADRSNSKP